MDYYHGSRTILFLLCGRSMQQDMEVFVHSFQPRGDVRKFIDVHRYVRYEGAVDDKTWAEQ